MRYFISVLVDQQLRDYVRDLARFLGSYKRNLQFVPLTQLHFNLKYLGQDLSLEDEQQLAGYYQEQLSKANFQPFEHPLLPVTIRLAGLKKPESLRMRLKQTPELNELARIINDWAYNSGVNNLVIRKDYNRLIGSIKLANFKGNISTRDQADLEQKLKEFPAPKMITISNLVILTTHSYRGKLQRQIHKQLNFQ